MIITYKYKPYYFEKINDCILKIHTNTQLFLLILIIYNFEQILSMEFRIFSAKSVLVTTLLIYHLPYTKDLSLNHLDRN